MLRGLLAHVMVMPELQGSLGEHILLCGGRLHLLGLLVVILGSVPMPKEAMDASRCLNTYPDPRLAHGLPNEPGASMLQIVANNKVHGVDMLPETELAHTMRNARTV